MYKEDSEVDLQLVAFLALWPWWAKRNGRRGIRRNGGIFRNVVIVTKLDMDVISGILQFLGMRIFMMSS